MKTIHLNQYQVIQLSSSELLNTVGGDGWADFKSGFVDGWNWTLGAAKSIAVMIAAGRAMVK